MWLFELFPVQRHIVEAKLLGMGKTLDSSCMKRDGKYENASSTSDYEDAALLCPLWYLFGRASDLSFVRKQNLSVDAGKVFFVRFIRMKPSEEQGILLFPDAAFVTCPLHAIAMAIITQTAPTVALIDNLPDVPVATAVNLSPLTPLLEVLNHPEEFAELEPSASPSGTSRDPVDTTPTIYIHVNRLLERVARVAGASDILTSHSFRRGGAQHVNGCDGLTQCWTFDRGAWNMSTTNKGFNYIFNTCREDHEVSKTLSRYDTETKVKALDLKLFDTDTREKISDVQRLLFTTCYRMESAKYNLSQQALDVPTAYLILHYPLMKKLQAEIQAVRRLGNDPRDKSRARNHPITEQSNQSKIIDHQRSVSDPLMEHIKRQDERMDNLEAKMDGTSSQDKNRKRQRDSSQEQDKPKRRRGSMTNLHSIRFAWYAQEPRMWQSTISKQQKSDAKLLVAFMKLFLDGGFELDTTAPDYRDRVLNMGNVLKHLRSLHRSGILNAKIEGYQRLIQTAAIKDPAPGYTQDVLEVISE
ncbi:Hypothetical protein PHPALM_8765 [Phytophthora palmivora]|uniref:Uncharacterized protein n=1 Tax=Phytophthora palmivora TaxID=4796 RepID=A0A2P4Y914_9STRA|nr:Hypothetical protein PHPALM_8765 [Phytophthora palmivora]